MPHTKKSKPIEKDEIEEIVPSKIKKEFDLEGHEIFPSDKAVEEVEPLEDAAEGEDAEEGQELDEEEIDPFKDKWEE